MRAVVLRDGRLEVRETADPVPGEGELLLRTLATAICASDVHFMDHHDALPEGGPAGMVYDPDRDIVLGHEFVGEVIGHGPDCTDQFPIGTRVTAMPILLVDGGLGGTKVIGQHPEAQGSFGELLVVNEMMARAVPGDVSDDAVALVDAFAVGEFYVRSSRIEPGEVAHRHRRRRHRALRRRRARCPGDRPDHRLGLQPRPSRPGRAVRRPRSRRPRRAVTLRLWRDIQKERWITKPAVVFECVGAPGLIQQIIDSCEMWTRIFAAGGWYTGDTIDCTAATHKGVAIQFGGGPHPEDWYGTLDAICDGRLDPLPSLGKIIGLDEVPDALGLTRRSEGPPRIVVHPNS